MKLGDLSVLVIKCVIPLSTFIFSLLLQSGVIMLQFARLKITGIVYHSYIVYKKRLLDVVQRKPVELVSRNIGI